MTPTQAREAAGLTVEQAARLARITPAYLRRKEREGSFSVVMAERMERICRCDIKVFLAGSKPKSREETNGRKRSETKQQRTTSPRGGRSVAFPAASAIDGIDGGRGARA